MKTFLENLETFEKSMGFTRSDVVELSELSEQDIQDISTAEIPGKSLFTFCINVGIDISSVYSDTGFKMQNLENQYDRYPNSYKQIVTKHLFNALSRKFKSKSELKEVLVANIPDRAKLITRLFTGNSVVEVGYLNQIQKAVSNVISESEFKEILGTVMFSKIPNHNYNVTRTYFNVSYKDVGDYLNVTSSTSSNWGGHFCSKIPSAYLPKICKVFGNYSTKEFCTQLIHKSDLLGRPCSLSLGGKLPDPPFDKPITTITSKELTSQPRAKTALNADPIILPTTETNSRSKVSEGDKTISDYMSLQITDEIAFKMFTSLDEEGKYKVKRLISELFIKS